MSFADSFERTLGLEKEFSDNPKDRGGLTRFGITEVVARAHDYTGDMKDLPLDTARTIAKAHYWDQLRLDDVCALSPKIADKLFDTGYNMGIAIAGQFLQRMLNVLNRGATDYPDLTVDGLVGFVTIANLRAFFKQRGLAGEIVLLKGLNGLQACRYVGIAEANASQEEFEFGWLAKRIAM